MATGVMIGFFMPADVGQKLYDQAVAAGLDATKVDDLHLTLVYLGEADDLSDRKDDVLATVADFASQWQVMEGTIGGIGRFNASENSDGLTPIYASFDCAMLSEFRASLARWMKWSSTPPSAAHGFTPHIALARLPPEAAMPDLRIETSAVRLENLTLAWGDERHSFPLGRRITTASEMKGVGTQLRISESVQTDGRVKARFDIIYEMKGVEGVDYPKIELPKDVNLAELNAIYDNDPVFTTLPIGQFEARSRNGRKYRKSAMLSMLNQVNARKPEGMRGHLDDHEMGTRYDDPQIRWLKAQTQSDIVFGKLIALTPESRRYYKVAKATNAVVGTSLFAYATMEGDEVVDLELITIDMADPARVGVLMTAAKPLVTNEMTDEVSTLLSEQTETKPEEIMPDTTVGMVTTGEAELQQQRLKLENAIADRDKSIRDMQPFVDDAKKLRSELKLAEDAPLTTAVIEMNNMLAELQTLFGVKGYAEIRRSAREMKAERDTLAAENAALLGHSMDAIIEQKVKLPTARPIIKTLIEQRRPTTNAALQASVEEVFALPQVTGLLALELQQTMGEAQKPPADAGAGAAKPKSFLKKKPE